jgi:hypothetical protein
LGLGFAGICRNTRLRPPGCKSNAGSLCMNESRLSRSVELQRTQICPQSQQYLPT